MTLWQRRRREDTPVEAEVLNTPPPGGSKVGDGSVDREALRRITGVWSWLREVIVGYGIAAVLFAIALLIAGWEWAIAATVVAVLAIWLYTGRVVQVPGVRVVVVGKDPQTNSITIAAYVFPPAVFQAVHSEGISSSVLYRGQLAYLAKSIEWDASALPELVPVRINWAWIHYNPLNFLLRFELLDELQLAFALVTEKSERQEILHDALVRIGVRDGLRERVKLLFSATRDPTGWPGQEKAIRERIAELGREIEGLSVETKDGEPDEVHAGSSSAAPAEGG